MSMILAAECIESPSLSQTVSSWLSRSALIELQKVRKTARNLKSWKCCQKYIVFFTAKNFSVIFLAMSVSKSLSFMFFAFRAFAFMFYFSFWISNKKRLILLIGIKNDWGLPATDDWSRQGRIVFIFLLHFSQSVLKLVWRHGFGQSKSHVYSGWMWDWLCMSRWGCWWRRRGWAAGGWTWSPPSPRTGGSSSRRTAAGGNSPEILWYCKLEWTLNAELTWMLRNVLGVWQTTSTTTTPVSSPDMARSRLYMEP